MDFALGMSVLQLLWNTSVSTINLNNLEKSNESCFGHVVLQLLCNTSVSTINLNNLEKKKETNKLTKN